eukprot:gene15487-18390_t
MPGETVEVVIKDEIKAQPTVMNLFDSNNVFYSIDLTTGNIILQHTIPFNGAISQIDAALGYLGDEFHLLGSNGSRNEKGGIPILWSYISKVINNSFDEVTDRKPLLVEFDFNNKTQYETIIEFPYSTYFCGGYYNQSTHIYYYAFQSSIDESYSILEVGETIEFMYYNSKFYFSFNTGDAGYLVPGYVVEIETQLNTSSVVFTIPTSATTPINDFWNFVMDVNGYITFINNPSLGLLDIYFLNRQNGLTLMRMAKRLIKMSPWFDNFIVDKVPVHRPRSNKIVSEVPLETTDDTDRQTPSQESSPQGECHSRQATSQRQDCPLV